VKHLAKAQHDLLEEKVTALILKAVPFTHTCRFGASGLSYESLKSFSPLYKLPK